VNDHPATTDHASVGGRPSGLQVWWLAARPATLPAAVAPVLVGLGAAFGSGVAFRADTAVACLAVALLLQIAANLANDLSDFTRGADTPDRTGPLRAAAAGWLTPRDLQVGIGLVLVLAGLVGSYLVAVGGIVLLALGVAAMIATLAYTGGPWPYGYRGLGEVFVFAFFGLVAVVGTAYLQALEVAPLFWWAAIPVGSLITGILVVNNLRDIPTDRAADKRTLAVTLGEAFAKGEYLLLVGVAFLVPVALFVSGQGGVAILLPLIALIPAWAPVRRVAAFRDGDDRRSLNPVLKATARLSLIFAVLFALGLASGGIQ
jgi:1,4-dihydroxy-2-naphthoate polyprenyltransferase